jgi:hypothetical protein
VKILYIWTQEEFASFCNILTWREKAGIMNSE